MQETDTINLLVLTTAGLVLDLDLDLVRRQHERRAANASWRL
jgi:hypothetical protein